MQDHRSEARHDQTTVADFIAKVLYAILVFVGLYCTMPVLASILWLIHRVFQRVLASGIIGWWRILQNPITALHTVMSNVCRAVVITVANAGLVFSAVNSHDHYEKWLHNRYKKHSWSPLIVLDTIIKGLTIWAATSYCLSLLTQRQLYIQSHWPMLFGFGIIFPVMMHIYLCVERCRKNEDAITEIEKSIQPCIKKVMQTIGVQGCQVTSVIVSMLITAAFAWIWPYHKVLPVLYAFGSGYHVFHLLRFYIADVHRSFGAMRILIKPSQDDAQITWKVALKSCAKCFSSMGILRAVVGVVLIQQLLQIDLILLGVLVPVLAITSKLVETHFYTVFALCTIYCMRAMLLLSPWSTLWGIFAIGFAPLLPTRFFMQDKQLCATFLNNIGSIANKLVAMVLRCFMGEVSITVFATNIAWKDWQVLHKVLYGSIALLVPWVAWQEAILFSWRLIYMIFPIFTPALLLAAIFMVDIQQGFLKIITPRDENEEKHAKDIFVQMLYGILILVFLATLVPASVSNWLPVSPVQAAITPHLMPYCQMILYGVKCFLLKWGVDIATIYAIRWLRQSEFGQQLSHLLGITLDQICLGLQSTLGWAMFITAISAPFVDQWRLYPAGIGKMMVAMQWMGLHYFGLRHIVSAFRWVGLKIGVPYIMSKCSLLAQWVPYNPVSVILMGISALSFNRIVVYLFSVPTVWLAQYIKIKSLHLFAVVEAYYREHKVIINKIATSLCTVCIVLLGMLLVNTLSSYAMIYGGVQTWQQGLLTCLQIVISIIGLGACAFMLNTIAWELRNLEEKKYTSKRRKSEAEVERRSAEFGSTPGQDFGDQVEQRSGGGHTGAEEKEQVVTEGLALELNRS